MKPQGSLKVFEVDWENDYLFCESTWATSVVPTERSYLRSPTRREHGRRSCEHTSVVYSGGQP